jgi:hypothetical protein
MEDQKTPHFLGEKRKYLCQTGLDRWGIHSNPSWGSHKLLHLCVILQVTTTSKAYGVYLFCPSGIVSGSNAPHLWHRFEDSSEPFPCSFPSLQVDAGVIRPQEMVDQQDGDKFPLPGHLGLLCTWQTPIASVLLHLGVCNRI